MPVVVGGLLALIGGASTQLITHRLSSRREREKVFREKSEELVSALHAHREWVYRESNRLIFGENLVEQSSPLDQAMAIQALYFPELADALGSVVNAQAPLTQIYYKNAKERIRDRAQWIAQYNGDEVAKAYMVYTTALQAAVSATVAAAKKRLGSAF
jgi:hypothetical protein